MSRFHEPDGSRAEYAVWHEPQLSASIDLERCLSGEVLLHVFDLSGTHEVKTCYGDVVKIVNALRDYAKR